MLKYTSGGSAHCSSFLLQWHEESWTFGWDLLCQIRNMKINWISCGKVVRNAWEGSECQGVLVVGRVGAALGVAAVLSQAVTCWARAKWGVSLWFDDFVVLSRSWKDFSVVCGSSIAALQRLGFSVFVSTATAACKAFFLQILLFSSNLSSFPLLQHWLLPVRNCSSIPCAELHLSSLLWANCSLCPVGLGWVFPDAVTVTWGVLCWGWLLVRPNSSLGSFPNQ